MAGVVLIGGYWAAAHAGSLDASKFDISFLTKKTGDASTKPGPSGAGSHRASQAADSGDQAGPSPVAASVAADIAEAPTLRFGGKADANAVAVAIDDSPAIEVAEDSPNGAEAPSRSANPSFWTGVAFAAPMAGGLPSGGGGSGGSSGGGGAAGQAKAPSADDPATQDGKLQVSLAPLLSGPVPEPGTWALLLLGFGLAGGALRARTRARLA